MCELQRGDKLLKEIKAGVEAEVLYSSDFGSPGLQAAGCVGNQKVICSL